MRGIIEFDLDHGRDLRPGDPEHGLVVVQHRVVLGHVVLAYRDSERPGDPLDLGS
jgi:hypothetical protein